MTDVAAQSPPVEVDGVPVTINGVDVVAQKGELVIAAAERNGVYIPRFCYHPRMQSVGMCRMCIVEIDTGRGPALQPSCMIECTPDMKIETESPVTKKAQDGVLEFLLINHPLDCPVCDKGGECPLQDHTIAFGPGDSRFIEEKRHLEKPIPISDLVLLDRERCILCDRCTRFAKDVAGDPLIHFIHRGHETEVNTFPDEPFSSYFSGNTVQICPVGALTATDYRFKARPWDVEQVESTCQSCAVGCRVALQSSRNELLRKVGVDVDPVNWGWLCDRGRFDHQALHGEHRLTEPLLLHGNELEPIRWTDALAKAAAAIQAAINKTGPSGIGVIGGARLTNESAYAWAKFVKGCLGSDNIDAQLGDGLPADLVMGVPKATIDDVCAPGGVVVLATADIKEELPVLFLRLRHAVMNDGVRVVELSPLPTSFSSLAAVSLRHRPGEVAEAARALLDGVPAGKDGGGVDPTDLDRARALLGGNDSLTVVLGRQSVAESPEFAADAASSFLHARPNVRFLTAVRRANVHGALDMGLTPGFLPGRVTLDAGREWYDDAWPTIPAQVGLDATGILQSAADGTLDVLILLGADPLGDFPDRDLAQRAIAGAGTVIAIDLFLTESSRAAHLVLPAAGFGEVDGTTTNLEGRVSIVHQKVTPPGSARPDWMIAAELAHALDTDLELESIEQIWDEIERVAPAHRGLTWEHLGALGSDGVVVGSQPPPPADGEAHDVAPEDAPVADDATAAAEGDAEQADDDELLPVAAPVVSVIPETVRFQTGTPLDPAALDAYALRLVASRKMYDLATQVQASPMLADLLPGTALRINRYDFDRLGVHEGAALTVKSPRGVLQAEIRVDDTVPRGTIAVELRQPEVRITDLIDATQRVTDLRFDVGGTS